MPDVRVTFVGLKKLRTFFIKLPKELDRYLSGTNENFMEQVKVEARAKAPVDTGELKASIIKAPVRRGKNVKHWRLTVGANHGIPQEYGFTPHYAYVRKSRKYPNNVPKTWFVKKNTPFVVPAFEKNLSKYLNNLIVSSNRAVSSAGSS